MTATGLALVAAAVISTQAAEPTVLLPGLLDFPLVGGAVVSPDCGGERELLNPGIGLACVAFEQGGGLEALRNRYGQMALDQGWRFAFAVEASTIHFERPTPDGRCEHLALSYAGEVADAPVPDYTVLALIVDRNMPCVRGNAS